MKFSLYSYNENKINQQIKRYTSAGQWDKAAEQYQKLVSIHPDNLGIRMKWADACVKAGMKKEALEQYQWVGDNYLQLGEIDRAITVFKAMLNIDEALAQIRVKLGELYIQKKDTESAKNHFLIAARQFDEQRLRPQAVGVLQKLSAVSTFDLETTQEIAEMLLAREAIPEAINVLLTTAEHYLQEKYIPKALDLYRQVLELDANNEEAKIGLQVIQATPAPEQVAVAPSLEKDEWKVGLADAAEPSATEATLSPLPSTTPAANGIVAEEVLFEEEEDPVEDLLETLQAETEEREWNQEELQAHFDLGIVYQEMSLLDAAVGEFVLAARNPDLQLRCYQMLNQCYMEKGMPRQAKKYRRKAEEIVDALKEGDEELG